MFVTSSVIHDWAGFKRKKKMAARCRLGQSQKQFSAFCRVRQLDILLELRVFLFLMGPLRRLRVAGSELGLAVGLWVLGLWFFWRSTRKPGQGEIQKFGGNDWKKEGPKIRKMCRKIEKMPGHKRRQSKARDKFRRF